MKQGAGCDPLTHVANQREAARFLRGAKGLDIPLSALGFVDCDKSGFPTHGESNVVRLQIDVNLFGNVSNVLPLLL